MATPIPALVETSDPPLSTDSDEQFDAKAFPWAASLDPFGQSVSAIAIAARDNAEEALAAALGGDLPPLTGEALKFLRVKADESGAEFAEVPEPVSQPTSTWEVGTSTTEGIVSPAKVAASAAENSPVKAWVNFDGTNTVAIRESFNVSSITDNGPGNYTVNFATALADTNYAFVGLGRDSSSPRHSAVMGDPGDTKTTGAVQIRCRVMTGSGSLFDGDFVEANVLVVR